MSCPGSVSHWIHALKNGDRAAAQPLWERYHARLMGLARRILRASRRGEADEEDAVQCAFENFFRGLAEGRFPQLHDRDNLWRLLVLLTARRAIDQRRRARRTASVVTPAGPDAISLIEIDGTELEQVVGHEPTPALAAELIEQLECLLRCLDDPKLRQLALWKLEGDTNDEIAVKLGCARRTVIRKLNTIRQVWNEHAEP